jgi:hypothetical protein
MVSARDRSVEPDSDRLTDTEAFPFGGIVDGGASDAAIPKTARQNATKAEQTNVIQSLKST